MTPRRFQRLRDTLARRQPDLTVLMDNVHKPHNFSAVLRSCDAVGVLAAHGVWPSARLRPLGATSGGAGKWVRVHTHADVATATRALRAAKLRIVAAHASEGARDYRELDYTRPTAFVLGAELEGVSDQAQRLADVHVAIPMLGFAESLNVSVAAALLLFEAQRQRLAAGLYARSRLDPEVHARTLFEWAHPDVAAHCRRHGLAYPSMGEDGAIDPAFAVHRPSAG
jgi:tRNA (guanosine-2'-O-)-methyltransferase